MPKLLKDKRIGIYLYNSETRDYEKVATVWAHYRSFSVTEIFTSGANYSWNNAYFTFTKPATFQMTTYAQIEYNGQMWEIEALDTYEDQTDKNIRVHARVKWG